MKKRWEIRGPLSPEETKLKDEVFEFLKTYRPNPPKIIAEILVRKGLTNKTDILQFFEPSLEYVHDPFLFKDMEKAVERTIRAIREKQRITIYGDYDVDGTTATALLYLGLRRLGADVNYHIPHRVDEGYGLSTEKARELKEEKTRLIISVDCGINAVDEINTMRDLGMDVIVTDHHNPKDVLPNAYAIINPKQPDCSYPYKDLAGVGVAYKLLIAIYHRLEFDTPENVNRFLDLVAVGTIADIVPLYGENRIFSSVGLHHLNQRRNKGLNALINISGLSHKELTTTDIVFGLAPRINAAGRMGDAKRAVELLISDNHAESDDLALLIEKQNSRRQAVDQETFQDACRMIEEKYPDIHSVSCIVVSSAEWHPGVIGIVASKLVEKYYRPTIMIALSDKDGSGSGSGRSIANFDLFEALSHQEDLLESFGGHKYAAGLSILPEYIDQLETKLDEYIRGHLAPRHFIPPLKVDHEIELYEIDVNLIEWLERFAPFGPGNMRPVFFTRSVQIKGYPYGIGRRSSTKKGSPNRNRKPRKEHLKMKVKKDDVPLDLIGFGMGDLEGTIQGGDVIDIAYSLEWNTRQGNIDLQGKLKDIRIVQRKR